MSLSISAAGQHAQVQAGDKIPAQRTGARGYHTVQALADYISAQGAGGGAAWHSGAGVPASGLGANGDYYLNTSNGDVYAKAAGAWSVVDNLTGPQGVAGAQGSQGAQGAQGPAGPGVAVGGATGQMLVKASNTDYDTAWTAPPTQYTDEMAQDAVGGILADTGDIDFTYNDATPLISATIVVGAVTYAKMQDVSATDRLLGRATAGPGDIEEITCTAAARALLDDIDAAAQRATLGLGSLATQSGTFSGTSSGTNSGDQTITLTGDVTGAGGGSFAATIAANAVSFGKFAAAASAGFVGATGAGDYSHRTPTQVTAALDAVVGDSGAGGTKGLAPAPAAGDAAAGKFLKADGTWAAPAGGGGSPGGNTTEVQYNNAGAFAGAADVEIEGGQLRLPAIATPAAPAPDGIKLFGKTLAARVMAFFSGAAGKEYPVQPHLGKSAVAQWNPTGSSAATTSVGAAALTATGTGTVANVAATNRHTLMRRLEYLVTVAATTAVAGFRLAAAMWSMGSGAGNGGFHLVCRWGPATGVATATNRAFVGLANSTAAPTDVEPSSLINAVGMGWDAADTNIQVMHNDAAGTATKVNLGASFPVPTADRASVYELSLYCAPAATSVTYEVTDLVGGAVATGTLSTNLPGATTFLAPRGWMSVGGTLSVIGIALMGLYIESDY